jgi:SLOG in TRPM, prokaryote
MALGAPDDPLEVSSAHRETDARLANLIEEVRRQADSFVFLMGGASDMDTSRHRQALDMLGALTALARDGYRLAVGDGGTHAGIMEAAGLARRASGNRFLLVGVAPAIDVPPHGATPLDPNHSHIVTVAHPSVTQPDAWGSETETMYWLFARMSEGRPSVAVLVNGGDIALKEVLANVTAGRPTFVLDGSGRAADAIARLVKGEALADEVAELGVRAQAMGVFARPTLFRVLPLSAGADGLRHAIVEIIGRPTR